MTKLQVPGRLHTYSLIIGTVMGLLVAGLAVPFVFGHRIGDSTPSASNDAQLGVLGATPGASAPTGAAAGVQLGTKSGGASVRGGSLPAGSLSGASVTGPAVSNGSGPTAVGGASGGPAGTVGASDVGVTAKTIKIGVGIGDAGGLSKFGYTQSVNDAKKYFKVYIDYYNAHGGLFGRKIVPDYVTYDALNQDSMNSACLKWTVDDKVFAVINGGGLYGPPILCITRDHHTPLITGDQENASYFQAAQGMLISTQASAQRLVENMATFAAEIGALKGQKIGILDADGDFREPVPTALIPVLNKLGYQVTYEATMTSLDLSQYATQASLAVENMRNHGVTAVIMVHNFLADSLFAQDADKQLYYPRYILSDWGGLMASGATDQMPKSFDGAIGFTTGRAGEAHLGMPEPARDRHCVDIWNKSKQGKSAPIKRTDALYGGAMALCNYLDILTRGINLAGVNLTRTGFAAAVSSFGAFPMEGMVGGSLRPGKTDAADYARQVGWHYNCTCWLPMSKTSRFVKTPY